LTQIRVDAVTPTASGKAWRVRSGSRWFNAFKDSGIENHVGKVIDAEISTHEKYGDGIEKYKVMETPTVPQGSPKTGLPASNEVMVAPWWTTMASNIVAHAIAAGQITGPEQIKAWVAAVRDAAEGSAKGDIGF
jgi:hypothetical protein